MSDDNVFSIAGGKKEEERVKPHDALRQFADLLEVMEEQYGEVEIVAVGLVPEIGVTLCGNSLTGNDGMMTMLEIGKTAIVMQYLEGQEEGDDVIH
tara:strand:+ start:78 stop:365 length:288 start_codon:yes stop_codon:yes gene_type:complete